MTKRIFSILLALCMVFAFMPASAFAANSDTDVTLTADKTTVTLGETVIVSVNIPDFAKKPISSASITYSFDNTVFKAPDNDELETPKYAHTTVNMQTDDNENGEIIYSLSAIDEKAVDAATLSVPFTVKNDAAVKAGAYKFTLTVATIANDAGVNFATLDDTTKTVTVNVTKPKANLTADDFNITVPTDTVYGGSTAPVAAPTIKDSSKKIGAVTVKYNGTTEEPKVAGTYHVTFDVAESADYNAAKDLEIGTFKITQKELKMTAKAESRAYEEGNTSVTLKDIVLDGIVGNDEVSVDATKGKATVDTADAGTGKVVTLAGYELTGEQASNYKLTVPTDIKVAITKADFKGTTVLTKEATKGSTVTFDLIKELKLPADATFIDGHKITDTDGILDLPVFINLGVLTFKLKADAETGKTADIFTTVNSKNYNQFEIKIIAKVKDAGSTGGGGGGIIIPPTVQKPEIKLV